jgi:hypothetical protein
VQSTEISISIGSFCFLPLMLIDFLVFLSAPMHFLVTADTKSCQIAFDVIALLAPRLNVMDLKTFHSPARLATPAVALQDFAAKLAIRFRIKPQAGPLGSDPRQSVTCTSLRSWFLCDFGRPMTSRVRQGNKASRLPASKLTPARKSAQIISRQ